VHRILEAAEHRPVAERRMAAEFLERAWPRLLAWHRWLATARDPDGVGRVTIHHGWESGMDNSPRWDEPYAGVVVGDLPPYTRLDTLVVHDSAQRPSDAEYDRYLWLVEELRRARYDDATVAATASFAVEDVFFSAVLSIASRVLAGLGRRHGRPPADVVELEALADRYADGVVASVDPATGMARDRDRRTGRWLATETLAAFAPLLSGAEEAIEHRLLTLFHSELWCGDPRLAAGLPPSTSPGSPAFDPTAYWRGPTWPVLCWLFSWAFEQHGWVEESQYLEREGLRLLTGGHFGEYYHPFTGEPLGSQHQSWTAAVALDWLSRS
jgi:hypothetical protein